MKSSVVRYFVFLFLLCFASDSSSLSAQIIPIDTTLSETQYFELIDSSELSDFRTYFESPFLILLDDKQLEYYENLVDVSANKEFIKLYWRAKNPNPMLDRNEWLSDFLKRLNYVFEFYANKKQEIDDRGKYYLKYGEPTVKYVDSGGSRIMGFWNSVKATISGLPTRKGGGGNNLSASGIGQLPRTPDYFVYPSETWSYEHVMHNFVVHFVKEGSKYEEVKSLKRAIRYSARNMYRSWYWMDIMKTRRGISPSLSFMVTDIDELEGKLLLFADPETRESASYFMAEVNPDNPITAIEAKRSTYEATEDAGKLLAPDVAHSSENVRNSLLFNYQIAQFRQSNGETRVEITTMSPYEEFLSEDLGNSLKDTVSVEFGYALRNLTYNPLVSVITDMNYSVKNAATENIPNILAPFLLQSQSGVGELTLQVKDLKRDKIGYLSKMLNVRDFSGDSLMISDVQFYMEVNNDYQRSILPTFYKQDIEVAPYPFAEVKKSRPLFCYFEIYNLKSIDEFNMFDLEISLSRDQNRESFLKKMKNKLFGQKFSLSVKQTRQSSNTVLNELIALDVSNLAEGPYTLEVIVSNAGSRIANITRAIDIAK